MGATLDLSLSAKLRDLAFAGSDAVFAAKDATASSHELVDQTPRVIATSGAVGAAFVQLETPVRQVERLLVDLPGGSDLLLRIGGAVASVSGASAPPTLTDGWTAILNIDGLGAVTTSFLAADNTMALAAKRINYAHGAQVASVDPTTGALVIAGTKTGGDDARRAGYAYGSVVIVSGTALAALGLTAGTTYGTGADLRLGGGVHAHSFPAAALPRKLELSGSVASSRFVVAGKAS